MGQTAPSFDEFWQAYPKRVGKLAAQRVWNRMKPTRALFDEILAALEWQKRSRQWRLGFVPNPTTYLNQGRWLDENPETSRASENCPRCGAVPPCKTMQACRDRLLGRTPQEPTGDRLPL